MQELLDLALSDPWNRILLALAPILLPLPFIAVLNQILKALGYQSTIASLVEGAIRPALRDPERSGAASAWAIVAGYCLFVLAAQFVDVFFPELGIPVASFIIGLAAASGAAISLIVLAPMLKIVGPDRRAYGYTTSGAVMLISVPLLVAGLVALSPPERIDLLVAVAAGTDDQTANLLIQEIDALKLRDPRLRFVNVDSKIVDTTEAEATLAQMDGELIIFGEIIQFEDGPAGTPVSTLRVRTRWPFVPTELQPNRFEVAPCRSSGPLDLAQGMAIQASSVTAFTVAYRDVLEEGPRKGIESLALAYRVFSERAEATAIDCPGTKEVIHNLGALVYDAMSAGSYPWSRSDVELAFRARETNPALEDLNEKDPLFWRSWAQFQFKHEGPTEALQAVERACAIDPGYEDARRLGREIAVLVPNSCASGGAAQ